MMKKRNKDRIRRKLRGIERLKRLRRVKIISKELIYNDFYRKEKLYGENFN
jgi:hypothetical protein